MKLPHAAFGVWAAFAAWPPADAAGLPLQQWIASDLLPYVEERLARHPRFNGEKIEIVTYWDDRVDARPDGLTAFIRQQLGDHLQGVEGVQLVQAMPIPPWPNYRSIQNVRCPARSPATIQLALTITVADQDPALAADELRLQVRAMDLVERQWIGGFSRVWQGTPTNRERQLLTQTQIDEGQRGNRDLPFTDAQPDLLASYLTLLTSCHLNRLDRGKLKVHLEAGGERAPFFTQTVDLYRQYLGRFREIEWVDDASAAALDLAIATFAVGNTLTQVWVDIAGRGELNFITGTDSPVYAEAVPTPQATPSLAARTTPSSPPSPAASPAPRTAAGSTADAPRSVTDEPPAAPPRRTADRGTTSQNTGRRGGDTVTPLQAPAPPAAGALLASFNLVSPPDRTLCIGDRPWRRGMMVLDDDSTLPSGSCFAARIRANVAARLYLVALATDGRLTRLMPNDCQLLAPGVNDGLVQPDQVVHLPRFTDGALGVFQLDRNAGRETLYVIVVDDKNAEARLLQRLNRAADPCRLGAPSAADSAAAFERSLDEIAELSGGRLDWSAAGFVHTE